MKKDTLKIILILVVLFTVNFILAQTPPNRTPPPPPGSPIDGGIFVLLTIAIGFAIKKLGFKKK